MKEIIELLQENILTTVMLLCILGVFIVLNMILGGIMAATVQEFDKKRFFLSIIKAILICLVVVVFCSGLDILPYILARISIVIPSELMTTIEVMAVLVVAITKYAREIYEKLLTLLDITEEKVKAITDPDGVNDPR